MGQLLERTKEAIQGYLREDTGEENSEQFIGVQWVEV